MPVSHVSEERPVATNEPATQTPTVYARCEYRGEQVGERDGNLVYQCRYPFNVARVAARDACKCGDLAACERCPWFDEPAQRFRYPDCVALGVSKEPVATSKPKARFVRTTELIATALAMIDRLPADIAMVAGVPRSGMAPAGAIATHLGVPLGQFTKDGKINQQGNGERPMTHRRGRLLVVDDTIYSGHQMRRIRGLCPVEHTLFAAIFATPEAAHLVDFTGTVLPGPHLLEWNLFNSLLLRGSASHPLLQGGFALDLDGLLCEDPPVDERDTERFNAWCLAARPTRWRPTAVRVPWILTARRERYRQATESWLDQWGIRVDRLTMRPDDEPRDSAVWKAERLATSSVRWYIESGSNQARDLKRHWPAGHVIDIAAGLVIASEEKPASTREPS